jgi:diguanylate cyclase (GGDEF)-like protein
MRNKETEKLFRLAYTDAMTGLYNRNAYEEKLEKLNRANARLDKIMIVIVDINRMKFINDTYGHRTGDETIKTVAKCLCKTVGMKADVYRIGGDEFACIAEKDITSNISEFKDLISFIGEEKIYPLSVSIGYSKFDTKKDTTIDDLIRRCDKKMYEAKKEGL